MISIFVIMESIFSSLWLHLVVDLFKICFFCFFLHGFAAIIVIANLQGHILYLMSC